jgi:hypothetical protein
MFNNSRKTQRNIAPALFAFFLFSNIVFFTGLAFLLGSCLKSRDDIFKIVNATNKHLTIEAYRSNNERNGYFFSEVIEISPYSEHKSYKEVRKSNGVFNSYFVDSVIIKFNNEKFIAYKCNYVDTHNIALCNDKRNIIKWNEYYDLYIQDDRKIRNIYTYTITEQDYQDAEWY